MSRARKLSEEEWVDVFSIRCRTRKGLAITIAEQLLCVQALSEDRKRYQAMDADVFDATVPFGSSVKARR